jgi:beta-lactamase class A
MKVATSEFQFASVEEAFEKYYLKGFNSATLMSYADFLEKLVQGKLLQPSNTELLLSFMEKMETGEKRLKAGLPLGTRFAQKTGTQVRRLCNAGIVRNSETIITVCLEKFDDPVDGERTLQRVGEIISRSGVLNSTQHQARALVPESTLDQ